MENRLEKKTTFKKLEFIPSKIINPGWKKTKIGSVRCASTRSEFKLKDPHEKLDVIVCTYNLLELTNDLQDSEKTLSLKKG